MTISFNKYDRMLVLICWLMAAGLVGGLFQPARLLMVMLLPLFLDDVFRPNKVCGEPLRQTPSYRYELFFFLIWWLYAGISLLWAIEPTESTKSFIHLTFCFLGFGEVLWLSSRARSPQHAILVGWFLMFLSTLPIAAYEFLTDHHLSMSVQESDLKMSVGAHTQVARRFASVTFGNLNSYNVVLCLTFCLMMIYTLRDKWQSRLCGYIAIIIIVVLIVKNCSRAALICLIFGLALYAFVMLKQRAHAYVILFCLAVAFGLFIYRFSDIFSAIFDRFRFQGFEDRGRTEMLIYGIQELRESSWMGIGIENFVPVMTNKYKAYVAAPHNLLLEIGVQFGVIILAGFIGLFIRVSKGARKGSSFNRTAALLSILPLIPISIIDSTYLLKITTWVYLASVYILCLPQYNDSKPIPVSCESVQ